MYIKRQVVSNMPIKSKVFFGVDLAGRIDEPTGIAAISDKRELLLVNTVKPDIAIKNYIEYHRPILVGIDAPLSLPSGRYGTYASRKCDRDLSILGIPTFATSMLAQLTFRAISLRKHLENKCNTIEIYPQATKVRLGLLPNGKKNGVDSREFLQTKLSRLVKNVPRTSKVLFNDDELDAILAAYTAYLHYHKLTEGIGDSQEGLIYIPIPDAHKQLAQLESSCK
jgi:predicted nuclease with RNAse H fold